RILLQELLIILAGLPLPFLTERLVAKPEVVFRRLRFFFLGTATETQPTHAQEQKAQHQQSRHRTPHMLHWPYCGVNMIETTICWALYPSCAKAATPLDGEKMAVLC